MPISFPFIIRTKDKLGYIYNLTTRRIGNIIYLQFGPNLSPETQFHTESFLAYKFFLEETYPLSIVDRGKKYYLQGPAQNTPKGWAYQASTVVNNQTVRLIPTSLGNWGEYTNNLFILSGFPDSFPIVLQSIWSEKYLTGTQAVFEPVKTESKGCTPGTIWAPDQTGLFACRRSVCSGAKCGESRYLEADGKYITEECSGSCPGNQICLDRAGKKTCVQLPTIPSPEESPHEVCPDPTTVPCGTKTKTGENCAGFCPGGEVCIRNGYQYNCVTLKPGISGKDIYIWTMLALSIILIIVLILYLSVKKAHSTRES